MKKTMCGVIDPYTLGFLLSLVIGGVTVFNNPTNDGSFATSKQQIQLTDTGNNLDERK